MASIIDPNRKKRVADEQPDEPANKLTNLILPLSIAALLMIICAVVQGKYTERWSSNESQDLQEMADAFPRIPLTFGDWQGTEVEDTPDVVDQYDRAKVTGHRNIDYVNRKTNKVVRVAIVCGHHRNTSIHTPDQCMVGAGFAMKQNPSQKVIMTDNDSEAEFLTAQFSKANEETSTVTQRMMWSWSYEKGNWIAPESQFFRRIVLGMKSNSYYKLYVTTSRRGDGQETKENADFIREFLPVLDVALYGSEEE